MTASTPPRDGTHPVEPVRVPHDADVMQLRSAIRQHGYFVMRELIAAAEVRRVSDAIAEAYARMDWLTGPPLGQHLVPNVRRRDGAPGWWEFAELVQSSEAFHRLAHHPALVAVTDRLVGRKVLHHGRRHLMAVNPQFWVPPHQEWTYIQGSVDFFTAYVPLTDFGGDAASVRVFDSGAPRTVEALRLLTTRGVAAEVPEDEGRWVDIVIAPGDVLFAHSLTLRAVAENTSDTLRLAALYRFQPRDLRVVKASIKPEHYPRLPDWQHLTKGWSTTRWVRPPLLPKFAEYLMPAEMEQWHTILTLPDSEFVPVAARASR